jgi:hypothetical protein
MAPSTARDLSAAFTARRCRERLTMRYFEDVTDELAVGPKRQDLAACIVQMLKEHARKHE